MTQKIKLARSQLEAMSDEELRLLANNLFKLEEANKNKKADFYLERMTAVQEKMHKSQARFVCCWAGNRCLRGDQKVITKRGPVEIRDIQENDEVVSFDQAANRFRYNRSSAAILKGSDYLIRVVHEAGEFVAHERHLVLCEDGKYQHVCDLKVEDKVLFSGFSQNGFLNYLLNHLQKDLEQCPSESYECAQLEKKKFSNCEDDYQSYNRLCGRQPKSFPKENQLQVVQLSDEVLSDYDLTLKNDELNLDNQKEPLCRHNPPNLKRILFENYGVFDLAYFAFLVNRSLLKFFERLAQVCPFFGKSLLLKQSHLPKNVSVQYGLNGALFSRIISIEKLTEVQEFYDIQVNIDHNYVTEDGAIHHNSGKSTGAIMELRWRVLGDHPFKKCKIPIKALLVCTDFENHVNKVIEPKIMEWFPPSELAKATITRNQGKAIKQIKFQNGSVIDILSHDQDLMIFESSDTDLAVFDEPPPETIFKAVWRGLTDRGGTALIAGTPIVQPWMIQEYKKWEDGNQDGLEREFIIGKTEDNAKNLGDGDVALGMKRIGEFAAMLSPEEREARLEGKPMELQGMIFKSWSRKDHLTKPFEWPYKWPIIESIDPHPRKPAGCSWIGISENGSKVLLLSGLIEGDVVELGQEIINYREMLPIQDGKKPRIIRTLIDNASNAPLTGLSITGQVRERVSFREELEMIIGPRGAGGPRIEAPPKNVAGKLEALRAWLTVRERDGRMRPDFYVFDIPENQDFINEIENYVWARYRNRDRQGFRDQPVKKNDDILDSILQVALTYKGHVEKESEIANIFKSRETYTSKRSSGRL